MQTIYSGCRHLCVHIFALAYMCPYFQHWRLCVYILGVATYVYIFWLSPPMCTTLLAQHILVVVKYVRISPKSADRHTALDAVQTNKQIFYKASVDILALAT